MSNEASKTLLNKLQYDSIKHIILVHINKTNNTPPKAVNVVG
jgi:hypothetical protein